MRRTERLFQIIQILRRSRAPITADQLAEELETSTRTIYRDMAELLAQRIPVRGEAGMGFVLDEGYDLPPLMLTADELEAAVLGARWVAARGDAHLSRGAENLIAKIADVVPVELQSIIVDATLFPVSFRSRPQDSFDVASVRRAIRDQRRMKLRYADEKGAETERIIWPFQIAYSEEISMICAWCELRHGFRHFRTDRVLEETVLEQKFPERVSVLRRRWKAEREAERCQQDG